VLRDVSDANASELPATFTAGTLTVTPLPLLQIGQNGQNFTLSWPVSAGDFALQALSNGSLLSGAWTNVPGTLQTNSGAIAITLPVSNQQNFYRLRKP
jgi:hypothetical protein